MNEEKNKPHNLSQDDLALLLAMKESGKSPSSKELKRIAGEMLDVIEVLNETLAKNSELLDSFRRAMRIKKSSEKARRHGAQKKSSLKMAQSGEFIGPPMPKKKRVKRNAEVKAIVRGMREIGFALRKFRLRQDDERNDRMGKRNRDKVGQGNKPESEDFDYGIFDDKKLVSDFLAGMPADFSERSERSDEEYAAAVEKAIEEGKAESPCSTFTRTPEGVFGGSMANQNMVHLSLAVNPQSIPPDSLSGLRRCQDFVERKDLVINTDIVRTAVESVSNPSTGFRARADTERLGPKGYEVTWRGLVNAMFLVIGYALPLRRLERMTGGHFTASRVCKYLAKTAEKALPVYFHLMEDIANATIIGADSAVVRVSEWTRVLESGEVPDALLSGNLSGTINEVSPFLSPKKSGDGPKTKLHTTILSGRANPHDPRSLAIVYRTHVGDVGNILNAILPLRTRPHRVRRTNERLFWSTCNRQCKRLHRKAPLVIHGDLSPANRVSESKARSQQHITYAGCLAHLRRPFVRYRDQDPELCDQVLALLDCVLDLESRLDEAGRNRKNVRAIRLGFEGILLWGALRFAEGSLEKWSAARPLGQAIRYFKKHFEELTIYLRNPHLEATNNTRERLLRYEKLMDASSFGRDTLEGRARYDVLRSLIATCTAAQVDARHYLLFLLLASADDIAANPQNYAPRAYAKHLLSIDKNDCQCPELTTLAKKSIAYMSL